MDREAIIAALKGVSTASITTILLKKGLRNIWMRGPRAQREGQARLVGPAFTLRFIPAREDLPRSTRAAIEEMPAGCMVVVGALGIVDAGIFGDILCARMAKRGVAGLITDGVVRDIAGVRATGLPIWSQGTAASPSVAGLIFEGWQQPIGCGGVAIYPDDLIVADQDGAVVVPAAHAEHVATAGPEQERLEDWIMSEVARGVPLPGLYPPDAATRARYEARAAEKK
jgi:regulator of RNase E activity RraA